MKWKLLFFTSYRYWWDGCQILCMFVLCYSVDFVKWSSQGMLRMSPEAMNSLFKPTIDHIIQHLSKF